MTTVTGLVLTALILACRYSQGMADFYALSVYPVISGGLSLLSSPFPFSVQDLAIPLIIAAALTTGVRMARHKAGWKSISLHGFTLVIWIYIWVYGGWCLNYERSSIYQRTGIERADMDEDAFKAFLSDFTERLNASAGTICDKGLDELEGVVKGLYAAMPEKYGLAGPRRWQHPKWMMFSRLYSKTGVSGYMGPLFSESHLNKDMLPVQLPFVYAHEYSHLMGVSSEAEANWWAYQVCMGSDDPALEHSALMEVFPHVWNNASSILSPEDFASWRESISQEVYDEYNTISQHWAELRSPIPDMIQSKAYNLFLKGNGIDSGMADYSGVIAILMSIPDAKNAF